MMIFVLVCLLGTTASSPSLCGTGVPARVDMGSTDIPVRASIPNGGTPPMNDGLIYFDSGTTAELSNFVYAPDYSTLAPLSPLSARREGGTPAPRAACSPSPFTERGLGGEVEQGHPINLRLDRNAQATKDKPSLERDAQATDDVPPLERDAQATGSLWSDKSGSLFEDFKARRVGDLVTIVVVENTTASARANTAVQKSESASTTAGVGPLLNFLWPELGASGKTDSNVQGNTARAGTLQTRITVQVVETFPNGVLRIEGRRTLKINEETQTLVFSGLVRIRDIRSDNTVPSTAIANAEIFFEGKGIVGSRQREGILTRLFKIIF